jgi:hypothetical protein
MFNIPTIISLFEVVLVLVPALLAVAYVTVAERKTMASMQRRLGPNAIVNLKLQVLNKGYILNDAAKTKLLHINSFSTTSLNFGARGEKLVSGRSKSTFTDVKIKNSLPNNISNKKFSSIFTKICLFLIRLVITIAGVILAKSLFLV